jgi:hypothetical protein
MAENRQGTDAVPITQAGTRLQENSDGSGTHLAKKAGESFAWNPADKFRPNPQRPVGTKDKV